jgi:hypothetical protein
MVFWPRPQIDNLWSSPTHVSDGTELGRSLIELWGRSCNDTFDLACGFKVALAFTRCSGSSHRDYDWIDIKDIW